MKNADDRYVSFEPIEQMVFASLGDDGKVDLSIYLSSETDDEVLDAVTAWADDTSPVIISPHFTVAAPVDYVVEGHELFIYNNVISQQAKPLLDALRAEFMAQVARIDALVYEADAQHAARAANVGVEKC